MTLYACDLGTKPVNRVSAASSIGILETLREIPSWSVSLTGPIEEHRFARLDRIFRHRITIHISRTGTMAWGKA